MGRVTKGVRGIRIDSDDYLVGMTIAAKGTTLLTITDNGYGKRTDFDEYRLQNRGGRGILNYNITQKTGKICAVKAVEDDNDLMLITSDGVVMRTAISEISKLGRTTQGVRVVRLADGIKVIDIALADKDDDDEQEQELTE